MTTFRPFRSSEGLRSDRSASDRLRHREKVREAIRDNLVDVLSEESIIGKSADRMVKVPIRGIREYRFVYGNNQGNKVATGNGDSQKGQVVGKAGDGQQPQPGIGPAGNDPGQDYYETEVSLAELIEMMFEDLELPELERKNLRNVVVEAKRKRKGFRRAGIRVHLDKRRTVKNRLRRKMAAERRKFRMAEEGVLPAPADTEPEEEERFPFHKDDMTYKRLQPEERPHSNAVVICVMDTSGSMDTMKKYLARSFFFLLYQFVRSRYQNVEVVFVAHHSTAREVTEEEFFSKGESGGTCISSGYEKALEIIRDRYHPAMWNVYAFHCSDGDNFGHDNDKALAAAKELCEVCNLFGYGEIKGKIAHPFTSFYASSMLSVWEKLDASNFRALEINGKDDIWPALKRLLGAEKEAA